MATENKKQSGPPLACAKDREDLIQCVLRTDCVMKKGNTPGDCIRSGDLPLPCVHLLANYADCKRGLLDMRRRFRGNHLSDEAKRAASGSHDEDLLTQK